jgi:triphosphatase
MPGSEIELKLRVRPEDLRRLSAAPVLAASRPRTQVLESVYFDTPDLKLHRAGTVLRVRRNGRKFIQSVKSSGNGAVLHEREEIETPVPEQKPDLAGLRQRFPALEADELRPIFTSRIRRTVRRIAGVEVAFDNGEITTPSGAAEPVSEVELELKSGTPAEVFALALELADSVPIAIETRTKSQRGYALAGERSHGAIHAQPIDLDGDTSGGEAVELIFRRCIDHLTANQAVVLEAGNAGSVHQMRVALRRMRSALGLLRDLLPADERRELAAEAKWLADLLGGARNQDVLLSETLEPVRKAFKKDAGLEALAQAAKSQREDALAELRGAIDGGRYTRFVLRLGAFVESRPWQVGETALELAARLLDKRARRARRLGKNFARLDVEERHELRIALKKLRYAAEFFRSLFPGERTKKYLKRLATLQGALGHINDVETARALLEALVARAPAADRTQLSEAAGRVIGWHARALADAESGLVEEWEALAEARPFWS